MPPVPPRLTAVLTELHPGAAREFHHLVLPWNVPLRVPADDFIGEWIRNAGVFDAEVTEALLRLLDEGEAAADVGAHVGHMSSAMARACGPSGRVTAFEPCAQNHDTLAENATLWSQDPSLALVMAIRSAVSNEHGTGRLCIPSEFGHNTGTPHLLRSDTAESHDEAQSVPCTTLDVYFNGRPEPALIKLDVEGRELDVLLGAAALMRTGRVRDIIFEEYEPYPAETHRLLESRGYTLFRLSGNSEGPELLPASAEVPPSQYDMPSFLATLDPRRAEARFRASGWCCHGNAQAD